MFEVSASGTLNWNAKFNEDVGEALDSQPIGAWYILKLPSEFQSEFIFSTHLKREKELKMHIAKNHF